MTPTKNNVEPTTSGTKRLRELLTERGAEWRRTPHYSSESIDNETVFRGEGIEWIANDHLNGHIGLRALRYEVSPEQAIAATLGRPTCRLEREPDSDRLWWCSNCQSYHEHVSEFPWEYCPRCGAKVVR